MDATAGKLSDRTMKSARQRERDIDIERQRETEIETAASEAVKNVYNGEVRE